MLKWRDFKVFLANWWDDFKRISYVDTKWLTAWIAIYLAFLAMDIFFPGFAGSSILKYVGIFLCSIYAYQKYHQDTMLILALFLTFLADTILVWTPWEIAGVYVFSFAQLMHILRLSKAKPEIIGVFSAMLGLFSALAIAAGLNPLYAICTVYALELLCNLALANRRYRQNPKNFRSRCALYGFTAFVACDLCVALRHLSLDGILPAQILPLVAFLVWVFYYPSQVLIANSSTERPSSHLSKATK